MQEELRNLGEYCVECGLCLSECDFLQSFCEIRSELAEDIESNASTRLPYSCTLCDLCESICPIELNIGNVCLRLRERMVEEGIGPLPIQKRVVDEHQEWAHSDSFSLVLPDTDTTDCRRVFFPGCHLSGYSADIVLGVYEHLRENLPGTGIMLGCCGAPRRELGEEVKFREVQKGIENSLRMLGAAEIIAACPNCFYVFKESGIPYRVRSLYGVLADLELPNIPSNGKRKFSLHDPCRARWQKKMQDSVRELVSRMGHDIDEMKYSRELTLCCGKGGEVALADRDLSENRAKRRAEEATYDILTYCASCQDALVPHKPTLHVLDLMFNPNWEQTKLQPRKNRTKKRETQTFLREQLLNRFHERANR